MDEKISNETLMPLSSKRPREMEENISEENPAAFLGEQAAKAYHDFGNMANLAKKGENTIFLMTMAFERVFAEIKLALLVDEAILSPPFLGNICRLLGMMVHNFMPVPRVDTFASSKYSFDLVILKALDPRFTGTSKTSSSMATENGAYVAVAFCAV